MHLSNPVGGHPPGNPRHDWLMMPQHERPRWAVARVESVVGEPSAFNFVNPNLWRWWNLDTGEWI
jgi:hypothetical protein